MITVMIEGRYVFYHCNTIIYIRILDISILILQNVYSTKKRKVCNLNNSTQKLKHFCLIQINIHRSAVEDQTLLYK